MLSDRFDISAKKRSNLTSVQPNSFIIEPYSNVLGNNQFAVIFITSLEKDKDLNNANSILITTVARAKNTGMEYNAKGDTLISVGTSPLLLEPVNVQIKHPLGKDYNVETSIMMECKRASTSQ